MGRFGGASTREKADRLGCPTAMGKLWLPSVNDEYTAGCNATILDEHCVSKVYGAAYNAVGRETLDCPSCIGCEDGALTEGVVFT